MYIYICESQLLCHVSLSNQVKSRYARKFLNSITETLNKLEGTLNALDETPQKGEARTANCST